MSATAGPSRMPRRLSAEEVRALLAGESPGEESLRRLAPELGLHAADLFILAGLAVPDDLAPLDAGAAQWVPYIVMDAVHCPAAERRQLLEYVHSLPRERRSSPFAPERLGPVADGPGGRLIRMCQYRNLSRTGLAHTLAVMTPTYLSASTYGMIGASRKELTPGLVTDFAALLGFEARQLAVLAGAVLPEPSRPPAQEAVDAAALLWAARALSAAQAQHVAELAGSLRGDSGGEYRVNLPGR
ncbi:hypothetical protein ABZ434_00850 [Streptomyces sp. NPDC005761]|uniref:hypothetical protein n=1 Tax=Streptomyces sp. NPDC005761 TaxID=3157066 RepID=UPI0033CB0890